MGNTMSIFMGRRIINLRDQILETESTFRASHHATFLLLGNKGSKHRIFQCVKFLENLIYLVVVYHRHKESQSLTNIIAGIVATLSDRTRHVNNVRSWLLDHSSTKFS